MIQDSLKVYLFNVGAGDHIMLQFPDNSLGIIDSFYTYSNLQLQEPPALTYLKYLVAQEEKKEVPGKVVISFLCISHADIDHVKDIDLIFRFIMKYANIIVLENLWLFGGHADDITLYQQEILKLRDKLTAELKDEQREELEICTSKYIECLENINKFKEFWRKQQNRGEHYFTDFFRIKKYGPQKFYNAYSLGPISKITNGLKDSATSSLIKQLFEKIQEFLNPLKDDLDVTLDCKLNRNSISAILGIRFSEYNLIFGGDATKETLEASLNDIPERLDDDDGDLFNPDFFKVSHHGSKNSSSTDIWYKLYNAPKGDLILGISAGLKHSHPHSELYTHLTSCCSFKGINQCIYRTNQCADCKIKARITEKPVDVDYWFKYHGCELDAKVLESFEKDAEGINPENIEGKNLLAYIFEFPTGGKHTDIKVYEAISSKIGKYHKCVFGEQPFKEYCGE